MTNKKLFSNNAITKYVFRFFEQLCPRLTSKFAKSANMTNKNLFFNNMCIKNAEFEANFESIEKLQKDSREKSYQRKSDITMKFLIFITVCKRFRPITSFGCFFLELCINFVFNDTHIELLQKRNLFCFH